MDGKIFLQSNVCLRILECVFNVLMSFTLDMEYFDCNSQFFVLAVEKGSYIKIHTYTQWKRSHDKNTSVQCIFIESLLKLNRSLIKFWWFAQKQEKEKKCVPDSMRKSFTLSTEPNFRARFPPLHTHFFHLLLSISRNLRAWFYLILVSDVQTFQMCKHLL